MKAAVTGGAGFIGSHLVERLLRDGHEVTVFDDLSGGTLENLAHLPPVILRQHRLGMADMAELKDHLAGTDVLYHLAADATEGRSQFTPWRCTIDGAAASAQVFAAAAAVGVKRIVFTSSIAVYGEQEVPFTEAMEPRPVDVYGVNKRAAERMLQILAETHGFEYVILRPYNVYGPRQCPMDRYRNVVTILISRLMRGLPMEIYGDGEQVRAFTWIGDVVGQIAEAGWRSEVRNEIFNVGTCGRPRSVQSLARVIAEAMSEIMSPWPFNDAEANSSIRYVPARPHEVKVAWSNSSKWWNAVQAMPPSSKPLGDGIREVAAWMLGLGIGEPPRIEVEIPSDLLPEGWR